MYYFCLERLRTSSSLVTHGDNARRRVISVRFSAAGYTSRIDDRSSLDLLS